MCIYAMNENIVVTDYQNKKEPNFYQCLNGLLRIASDPINDREILGSNIEKTLKWIDKYGSNKYFQLPFKSYGPNVSVKEGVFNIRGRSLKKVLNTIGIKYVDNSFEAKKNSYQFYLNIWRRQIDTINTIVELYFFLKGDPLKIIPAVCGEKPVLPFNIIL